MVLIDLEFGSPHFKVTSTDPNTPGIAGLVRGKISAGDAIIRDRAAPLHLIGAGQAGNDQEALIDLRTVATTTETLTGPLPWFDHAAVAS